MINFGFKRSRQQLPRLNRLFRIPNRAPFTDTDGNHDGPPQLLQYIQGPVDLLSASIVGTEAVDSKQGTATVTVSAGKLSVGSGTLWSFSLSNGSQYEFGSGGWVWDVGANDRPLSIPPSACKEGREFGSDYFNSRGWAIAVFGSYPSLSSLSPITTGTLVPSKAENSISCGFLESDLELRIDGTQLTVNGENTYVN